MTQWSGKLFVFRDDAGEHISLSPPRHYDAAFTRAYAVIGPFIPIGLQKTITLQNSDQWIGELRRKGFTCEPCTVES